MMNLGLTSSFAVQVTVIANEFIDKYMASANGEYVKVYLYLLRHGDKPVDISAIADALNHTEADVKRALSYWEKAGVLMRDASGTEAAAPGLSQKPSQERGQAAQDHGKPSQERGQEAQNRGHSVQGLGQAAQEPAAGWSADLRETAPSASETVPHPSAPAACANAPVQAKEIPQPGDGAERMKKLSKDEEFSTLLYVAQQYLGKMFTSIECEKFAYFYDVLKMSGELLEYLSEYCAQNGHTSIRYIEKVALNWYQVGITTKAAARDYTMRFSKDISSVMKAFGLTSRNPGTAEKEIIKKWFYTYGFDRPIVIEACNRTIKATQTPSFQYADKILTGWKENGVKTLGDVEELDKKRQLARGQSKDREPVRKTASANRFRNFEERNYNYDEAIWDDIRKRYKKGGSGDGTE